MLMSPLSEGIIVEHLQANASTSPRQWGFIPSKMTISALIKVVDDWSRALDIDYLIPSGSLYHIKLLSIATSFNLTQVVKDPLGYVIVLPLLLILCLYPLL